MFGDVPARLTEDCLRSSGGERLVKGNRERLALAGCSDPAKFGVTATGGNHYETEMPKRTDGVRA